MPTLLEADSLARFVPAVLTDRLLRRPSGVVQSWSDGGRGSLLFADISGFSRLTDQLSRKHDGAEQIGEALDDYFGLLIDIVRDHGGDVLSFAGDAVLAVWPYGETEEPLADINVYTDLSQPVQLATACALQVQSVLGSRSTAQGIQLSMRICITAGTWNLAQVGGVLERWELLVTGAPVAQLADLKPLTAPGQVVISPQGHSWLSADFRARPVSTTMRGPPQGFRIEACDKVPNKPSKRLQLLSPDSEKWLRMWLPGAILSRLAAGTGLSDLVGELRRVSTVFVKLPISLGESFELAPAQAVIAAIQRGVYRYDGSIDKISVDEKGAVLIACFGVPPMSHADDPLRSVQAALQIRNNLKELGQKTSIGVATGQVFCGMVGNHHRAEYTVLGPAVNLAARLMEASSEDILVDDLTWITAHDFLEFDSLPALLVKGRDEPVVVHRPTGVVKAIVRQRTQLVGRTAERDCLSDCMQALVRARESSNVILIGEAGIGKTRLMDALESDAERLGMRVLKGSGEALETAVSYRVWGEILASCFGWSQRDDNNRRLQKIHDFLAGRQDLLDQLPLMGAILPLDLPDNATTRALSGEGRAALTIQLVVAVLAIHASRYHTLIMIEDAHWIDSTSWALLRAARMSVNPAMFVVATRPVELPVEFDPVQQSPHTHVLRIHPLTRDDIATLSRQRLGVRSLPEEVIDLIHQRAGGNALFVEELALVLRDRQYIELRGEDAVLAVPVQQLARSELPATVGGVIVSRLDKLPVSQQVALKVAAVLGQQFPIAAVQDLYPQHDPPVDVPALLPPLMEQDLIRRGDSIGQFEFKHALAQEAIYGLMLFAQRRGLHKRAAEWFERKRDTDGGVILPILAFHWEQAGEYVKAIACLEQAGEQSLDRYANREATDLLERALTLHTEHTAEVLASDERLANWHRHLAEAWIRLGSLDASRKHGAEALRRLGWPLPQSALGTGIDLIYQLSRRIWAGLVGTKVAADARERERRIHASRVLNRLTELHIYAENAVGAVTGGLRELNTVEPAGPSPELGKALAVMAVLFGPAPPLRKISHRWADRAVTITESSTGVAAPLSYVLCRVAIVDLYVCRWDRAIERLDRAMEVARSCGDRRLLEEAIGVGLLVKFFAGRLQETLPMLEQLRNSSRFSANSQIIAWSHLGLAGSKIRLGDAHTAMLELESCDTWVEREGSNSEVLWKRGLTALAQWKLGHHDRALATADAALPLIGWPVAYWMQHALAAIAEVYISALAQTQPTKPDYRPLLDKANLALRGVRRFGLLFGFGRGHALLWQGALEATTGNRPRALSTWRRCVAECTRLQLQWELALAHRALALHLPPESPDVGLHAREAASALQAMGALAEREPLLERAHLRPHLGLAALL